MDGDVVCRTCGRSIAFTRYGWGHVGYQDLRNGRKPHSAYPRAIQGTEHTEPPSGLLGPLSGTWVSANGGRRR